MKKLIVVILGLIAAVCSGSVFYLLFSNENLGQALLSIILPAAVGLISAIIIGKITSPATETAAQTQAQRHSA